jgi:hypothetical protein
MKPVLVTTKTAPRPTRKSIARALYDTVDAIGGPATLRQIVDLLPSTDDYDRVINGKGQILHHLQQCGWQGYLVHNSENDRWQLAPISFYNDRRALIKQADVRSRAKDDKPIKPDNVYEVSTLKNKQIDSLVFLLGISLAFVTGIIAGYALGQLV